MYDVRSSVQEVKKPDSHLMHPKSAPIKPDPDASAGPKTYGGHIYSMFQGDELTRQKKLQQKAYFQELTRQVQEKKDPKPAEVPQQVPHSEKPLMFSGNYSNEISKLSFVSAEDDKKYPRYQKKYEIENHTGINVNTSQVFGGVLQRDEAMLLKLKKEEQQKEMQQYLSRQIQEKSRKREEEQAWRRQVELNELELKKTESEDVAIESPKKEIQVVESPRGKIPESINSKTLPMFNQEEVPSNDMSQLNEIVKKLIEEKEELKNKLMQQEKHIHGLTLKKNLSETQGKSEKPEQDKPDKNEKPKLRPPKSRVTSSQESKLKSQHDQERAKLAVIEEKLENARKKRIEQVKSKAVQKPRRISEARIESRETLTKPSRIKTAVSPIPKNQSLLESPNLAIKQDFIRQKQDPHRPKQDVERARKEAEKIKQPIESELSELDGFSQEFERFNEIDRDNLDTAGKSNFIYPDFERGNEIDRNNLDTAGKSNFIYPDADGNFPIVQDEIDKFVTNYEKRESPLISFKSPYRNSPGVDFDARFTFTSINVATRREAKPLVANKQGFPSDIFRLP